MIFMNFTGLRRRRGVVEEVKYFDNDDELEKKKKVNYIVPKLIIHKDTLKICTQIFVEIIIMDVLSLPLHSTKIEHIVSGVVNMIYE